MPVAPLILRVATSAGARPGRRTSSLKETYIERHITRAGLGTISSHTGRMFIATSEPDGSLAMSALDRSLAMSTSDRPSASWLWDGVVSRLLQFEAPDYEERVEG
jgi:hypothetical protein